MQIKYISQRFDQAFLQTRARIISRLIAGSRPKLWPVCEYSKGVQYSSTPSGHEQGVLYLHFLLILPKLCKKVVMHHIKRDMSVLAD
jgi:hypothetical protein